MLEKIKSFFNSSTFKSWFLGSSGYFMSSSTCPFCGKPGCPAGIGIGVMIGGIFALLGRGIIKLKGCFKHKAATK
jgi:hypothetical protein